jgi:hypothetical protein
MNLIYDFFFIYYSLSFPICKFIVSLLNLVINPLQCKVQIYFRALKIRSRNESEIIFSFSFFVIKNTSSLYKTKLVMLL